MPSYNTVSRKNYAGNGYVALLKPFFSDKWISEEGTADNITAIPESVPSDSPAYWCLRTTANGEWMKQHCDNAENGNHGLVRQQAMDWVQELKDGHWVDWQTRVIIITLQLRTDNGGVRVWIRFSVELPATNTVLPSFQMMAIQDREEKVQEIIGGVHVIMGYVIWIVLREGYEMGLSLYLKDGKYFSDGWNILDLTNLLLFFGSIIHLYEAFEIDGAYAPPPGRLARTFGFHNWYFHVLALENAKFYLGINACLLVLKCPKFLHIFVPRTSLLAKVLSAASTEIAYFSLMFFLVMISFADFFFVYLGSKLNGFMYYSLAIFTLFRSLFGDFDVEAIDYWSPSIIVPYFFLGYLFVAVFLLLSFFFAILGEAQSQVLTFAAGGIGTNQNREIIKDCLLTPWNALVDKTLTAIGMQKECEEEQPEHKDDTFTTGDIWIRLADDMKLLTEATHVLLSKVDLVGVDLSSQIAMLKQDVDQLKERGGKGKKGKGKSNPLKKAIETAHAQESIVQQKRHSLANATHLMRVQGLAVEATCHSAHSAHPANRFKRQATSSMILSQAIEKQHQCPLQHLPGHQLQHAMTAPLSPSPAKLNGGCNGQPSVGFLVPDSAPVQSSRSPPPPPRPADLGVHAHIFPTRPATSAEVSQQRWLESEVKRDADSPAKSKSKNKAGQGGREP